MYMNNSLLQVFFGCAHRKTTFPLTPIRRNRRVGPAAAESKTQTYIACLDCGKELPYDWNTMRQIRSSSLGRSLLALRRLATPFRLRSTS